MKAVLYSHPLTLEYLEVPQPSHSDGYVQVEVKAAGICGSDLDGFRTSSPPRVPPLVMGHEFAGLTPDGVLVAVNPMISCHQCDACIAGRPNLCAQGKLLGVHIDGGFAEYVSVPAENCVPVDPAITAAQGALVEPFANAVHAWNIATRASAEPLLRVGVIGAGAIGLATATVASRSAGVVVDIAELDEGRRRAASEAGFDSVVVELTGVYDVVFDAVGAMSTRQASVALIRAGGIAVWVGLHSPQVEFPAQPFVRNEKQILGSFAYTPAEFRAAVAVVAQVQPAWTMTRSMADGPEVFTALLADPGTVARVVLVCP